MRMRVLFAARDGLWPEWSPVLARLAPAMVLVRAEDAAVPVTQ